ncbi:acyl-CoA synthetase [Rhodococcus sp. HNM0569]|uniref:acyl-CoA synthetase n=1 Tax=Rhodococcus sp. HNM0569 TaxID=2716340 RepID=UPI00146DB67C|nr:acyl-CoA synthetase [Rhodococcus sp. HNM0569]NLU83302.1 acyl-CoA synthetase [Rhodococcus sp. HNM0569]
MAYNLADLVEHAIDLVPDRTALVSADSGRSITYGELEERANRLAHFLVDSGVRPGDKVAVYTRNNIECVEAMLAIYKARAVVVNVNFRYVDAELQYLFDNSDAVAVVYEGRYRDRVLAAMAACPLLDTAIEIGADGSALPAGLVAYDSALAAGSPERDFGERSADDHYMIYTGGTTGMPKGVVWRHEDVWRVLGGGIDFMTGEPVPDEYHLARTGTENPALTRYPIPPMIHGAAQWGTFQSLFTGGRIVLSAEFDAKTTWRIIEDHGVHVVVIVGDAMARPMIEELRTGSFDTSTLVALASSAALFSPSVKEQFLDALPNTVLTDSIGSSETGFSGVGIVARGSADDGGPRVTVDSANVVLDDEGHIVEAGSGVVGKIARRGHIPLGYYKDPDKTAATFVEYDGIRYSIPGDFATVAADGTVVMLGRGSVSINTGGEKVFPEEVEGALKAHADVFDAIVVGVPDERYGQAVAAVVQARPGAVPDFDDVVATARGLIAGYKVPRVFWIVDRIVRSPSGKPDYRWAQETTRSRPADAAVRGRLAGSAEV